MRINLNNKIFKSLENSENGEVSDDTLFYYSQNNEIISATYNGGDILQGQLIGKILEDNHLEFVYQHINKQMEMMTGKCQTVIQKNEYGKLLLYESWQWTCKDFCKGQSLLIEL